MERKLKKEEWLFKEIEQIKMDNFKVKSVGLGKVRLTLLFAICLCFGLITFIHCKDDFKTDHIADDGKPIWICGKCGFRNYDGIERCGICGERRR